MLVLPWLLQVLPIKPYKKTETGSRFEQIGTLIIQNRLLTSAVVGGLVLLSAFGISKIVLTDDWVTYFDQRYEFRQHTDFIIDQHSGVEAVEFSVPAGEPDGISKLEYLNLLDEFATWLRQQEKVDYVYSIADTIKRLNKNMHADDESFYALPSEDNHAAQYLLLYELFVAIWARPSGQNRFNSIENTCHGGGATLRRRNTACSRKRRSHGLSDNAPPYMQNEATGMATLFSHISKRNIETMLFGTLLLLAFISIALILVLKSVKYGLLSLIPNVLPPVAAIGLWGWVYGELGMAVAVVGAITLGVIVDDTIHMLTKYRAAKVDSRLSTRDSLLYMYRVVGKPMFITSLSLVIGFGVLSFSGFQVNWAMGVLAAWTIAIALITDLVLVPSILWRLEPNQ